MIRVESMSVGVQSGAQPLTGLDGYVCGFDAGLPSARVEVTFFADGEDLDRLMGFIRAAKEGTGAPPALPQTTEALPAEPIEAEFVDE